jgi:putative methylase
MKKSQLEIILSKLKVFSKPQLELEQYPLPGKQASDILWTAFQQGDIENKTIADLGCGTGILGIGALLLGAKKVYFLDKSQAAIKIAKENLKFAEEQLNLSLNKKALFLIGDIQNFNTKVQVTIQNPPFGTKTEHIDRVFLEKAMSVSDKIYSLHKTPTLNFLREFIGKNHFNLTNRIDFNFPLKQTMHFHRQKIKIIGVSLIRIERLKKPKKELKI